MTTPHQQILINYLISKSKPIDVIVTNFDQTFILENKDGYVCQVVFWENNVIECKIDNNEICYYYLHFEYNDFSNATKLIDDFMIFKNDFYTKETTRVLICCSSGFTSSLLADGLNRIIKEMNYRIQLDFGSCFKSEKVYKNYQLILLAPQIGYMKNQLQLKNNIEVIPTNIYASSNYHSLLTFILNHI